MNLIRTLLVLLMFTGFILLLACTVGTAWAKHEVEGRPENETIYVGLWKYCQDSNFYTYNEETVEGKLMLVFHCWEFSNHFLHY